MPTIPFALSVHHFVSSVGADAGFAAFVAVALLVLLFFSQARETANLRRRADEAGQRVQELEAELAAVAQQVAAMPAEISVRAASPRAAAAYGGVSVPAGEAGVGGAGAMLPPAAPAGVGAPALAAATRLIPDPMMPIGGHQPAPVGLADGAGDEATAVHPPPVTVAGGNGSARRPVAPATMQRPMQARPGGAARTAGGPARPAQGRLQGGQSRPGGPPRTMMATSPGEPRSGVGWVVMVLAALLLVGAVVAGVIVIKNINHGSSASKSAAAEARSLATRRAARVAAVNPATVTVAVLNGTNTSGLARTVSQKLGAGGYRKGYVGNFTANQTQSSTVVQYMRGDKQDAAAVAAALKLRPTAVAPIDQATQQIACPTSAGPCTSAVVVTVGSDLDRLATQ
jgi:LytR cell envelope-related transcriptional attenuator